MSHKWVSLHHHTTYSYGDGFGTPEQHLARAAELGYSAIAFTEHGNVSSHFRAEKAASHPEVNVKPIYGIEAYTGPVDQEHRQQYKWHLTVLAMDSGGYRNLNRLVTKSFRDYYYHATVGGQTLADYSDGLIILSGCTGSLLACTLLGGKGIPEPTRPDLRGTERCARRFADMLGDRYYLEVQAFPELEKTRAINPVYEALGRKLGIPLVATMDVHYPMPEDNEMQTILHAAHRGNQSVDDAARAWNYDVLLTMPEDDQALLAKLVRTGLSKKAAQAAINNSAEIGERCNVTLPKAERLRYPIKDKDWEPWQ